MKITLTASLLVAITPIHAITCSDGASALTFVKVLGINAASITCNGLPDHLEVHGKCGASSPCSAFCTVELAEDPFEALNTLRGEQKTRCEAAGGTYNSRVV